MNQRGSGQRVLWGTFLIVVLLTAVNFLFFLSPPNTQNYSENFEQRNPAGAEQARDLNDRTSGRQTHKTKAQSVACGPQEPVELAAAFSQARFQGPNCSADETVIGVTNQSNGMTATIFQLPNGQFTTDYLQLQPGENHIQVKRKTKDGEEHTKTLVVVRKSEVTSLIQ